MGDKIQMPSSGGGLMRYFDDYKSKIKFSPWVVLILVVLILVVEYFIHRSGWL